MNRRDLLTLGSILLGIVVLNVILSRTDLMLYLNTRAAPQTSSSLTKNLTWTPPSDTTPGKKIITIEASDGNETTTKQVTIEIGASVTPTFKQVTITPADTGVTIVATTSKNATEVGLDLDAFKSYLKKRSRLDTKQGTVYTFSLANLVSCTTYNMKLTALVDNQRITDQERSFITTGCPGNAAVEDGITADMTTQGGTLTLNPAVTVAVPSNAVLTDINLQIKQLERDTALNVIFQPSDRAAISGLYEMHALSDTDTVVSSFAQPVKVTLGYTPATDTIANTIGIYRFDGTSWQLLDNCSAAATLITCETTSFSALGVFGQGGGTADPTPAPATSGGGGSGDSGGGGGGGGGGGESDAASVPAVTYTLQVEKNHTISGSYSGIEPGRKTIVLAHPKAFLERALKVKPGNYYLDLHLRHDKPKKSFRVAVYLNNRAWKVIKIDNKGDNKYRTHRLGQLKNFRSGIIKFRPLDDVFDSRDPNNPDKDLNLYIDWWRLTTR